MSCDYKDNVSLGINHLHSSLKLCLTDETTGVQRNTPLQRYERALEIEAEFKDIQLTTDETKHWDKLGIDDLMKQAKEKHGDPTEAAAKALDVARENGETSAVSMSLVVDGKRSLADHEALYGGTASQYDDDAPEEKMTHAESMNLVMMGKRSAEDHQKDFGNG